MMNTQKLSFLSRVTIGLVLMAHGWSFCRMSDGSDGWQKTTKTGSVHKGSTQYALSHLLQ